MSASLLLLLLISCSGQPYVVEISPHKNDSAHVTIYIVNHGWHTGIIIPAENILTSIPGLLQRFSGADYLEFGWGDQGFYQASEITTGITLNAILWPSQTVVHVVALDEDVRSYFSNIKLLCISENELAALSIFLQGSFWQDHDGNIIPLKKGIYGNSQFYRGSGSYHLFNTCNKWTAKGLQSAGYDISPSLKLTAESIMDYLSVYGDSTGACE